MNVLRLNRSYSFHDQAKVPSTQPAEMNSLARHARGTALKSGSRLIGWNSHLSIINLNYLAIDWYEERFRKCSDESTHAKLLEQNQSAVMNPLMQNCLSRIASWLL